MTGLTRIAALAALTSTACAGSRHAASGSPTSSASHAAPDASTDAGAADVPPTPHDAAPAPDAPYLTGEERRAQIIAITQHHGDVEACWNDALERTPGHAAERVHVTMQVNASGIAQVTVDGAADPDVASCVQVRMRGHSYGRGEAVTVEADYTLGAGN